MAKRKAKKKSPSPSSQSPRKFPANDKVVLGLSSPSSRHPPMPVPTPTPLALAQQPSVKPPSSKTSALGTVQTVSLGVGCPSQSLHRDPSKSADVDSSLDDFEVAESSSGDSDDSSYDSSDLGPEEVPTSSPPASCGAAPPPSPPRAASGEVVPPFAPSGQWRNLFASNRSSNNCSKLKHYTEITAAKTCNLAIDDLDVDVACNFWKYCLIGYVSGKFPGYKALNSIISNFWHCDAVLNIHESGWLVYKFQNETDKLEVLRGGLILSMADH